jgi:hypothetical protein
MFKLEPFDTDPNHYYLRLNGEVVVVLLPSDIGKMIADMGNAVTPKSQAKVKVALEMYYKERRKS